MADRYFVDHPIAGDRVSLEGSESHHLAHVMRAKPGDEVVLFDGTGAEFPARVEHVQRSRVALAVLQRREIDRELPIPLTVAVALPKGDRQKWLIEKATEVGVSRLVPLRTARSVAQPSADGLERLRRGVVEASKQCGRNRLMEIASPLDWAVFLAQSRQFSVRWLAHPGIRAAETPVDGQQADLPRAAGGWAGAVGPEGGFTDEEAAQALAAGWSMTNLGPSILRVETAVVVLAARLADRLRDPASGA